MFRSFTLLIVLAGLTASCAAQTPGPLLVDVTTQAFKPTEVTTKSGGKAPAGTVEVVEDLDGRARRFSFAESAGSQFFTSWVNPKENWDEYEGFRFWVRGDGSPSCGGLEFIDGEDYGLRYGYCFSIRSTEWRLVTVAWSDLVPELAGPPVDPDQGFAPSRFRNVWVGKWAYWRQWPACSFSIKQMELVKKIERSPAPESPPGLARTFAKLKDRQPVTIVTMGDSLTDVNHWANRERRWPDLLAAKLRETYGGEVKIVNPAIGGTTLSQNVVLIPRWLQESPSPELVIVWFGGNDWDSGVRGPRYRQYLESAVDHIRRATDGASDILLCTTCPGFNTWETTAELSRSAWTVAKERQIGFADPASAFHQSGTREEALARGYWAWDNVHLGPAGHDLMVATVLRAIQSQGKADLEAAGNAYWMKATPTPH